MSYHVSVAAALVAMMALSTDAGAMVYCKSVGVPKGCVARPGARWRRGRTRRRRGRSWRRGRTRHTGEPGRSGQPRRAALTRPFACHRMRHHTARHESNGVIETVTSRGHNATN